MTPAASIPPARIVYHTNSPHRLADFVEDFRARGFSPVMELPQGSEALLIRGSAFFFHSASGFSIHARPFRDREPHQ